MVNLERHNQQNSTSSTSYYSKYSYNSFPPEDLLQEFEFQIMIQDSKTLFKSKAYP